MDSNDASVTLPALEENDVTALEAILMRAVRAQDETASDRELIVAANERIAKNIEVRDGAYAALKLFGFEGPVGVNRWDLVKEAIGADRYARVIAFAKGEPVPGLLSWMGDKHSSEATDNSAARNPVPIRVAVLEYLRTLGRGATAREVRQHLLIEHGIQTHEKTPGMTLYRLLKDGLVERKGRVWSASKAVKNNENKAPYGGAAGASEAGGTAIPSNHQPRTPND